MEILNKYQYNPKTDVIGKGGFATVYKAYDKILDIEVALKFFYLTGDSNKYTIINEIKRVIRLSHPNIVKYYGIESITNTDIHGQEENIQIGIMELAAEGQINTYLKQNSISTQQLIQLLIEILYGLQYLHSQGIIHRDIKPQNILLARDYNNNLVAKIADFGISKTVDSSQTSASMLLGTVEYMAPEQFSPEKYGINKKISYNVDIWAFGVMVYNLLKGEFIFGGKSAETSPGEIINKIVNLQDIEIKMDNIDEPFKTFIKKCLVVDANKRTSNINELIDILKQQPDSTLQTYNFAQNNTILNSNETKIVHPNNDANETKIITFDDESKNEAKSEITPQTNKKSRKNILLVASVFIVISLTAFALFFNKKSASGNTILVNKSFTDSLNMQMVIIGGNNNSFTLGDYKQIAECECKDTFSISVKKFKILNSEVTQKMWQRVMNDNRFTDISKDEYPAHGISWNEAKRFIEKLNTMLPGASPYRLPTEVEWEYASKINNSDTAKNNISWNNTNTKKLNKVKQKQPVNGLYDMLGNVYEWCDDWYIDYKQKDKTNTLADSSKVLRGGDYKNAIELVSSTCRNREHPNTASETIGFRLAQNN